METNNKTPGRGMNGDEPEYSEETENGIEQIRFAMDHDWTLLPVYLFAYDEEVQQMDPEERRELWDRSGEVYTDRAGTGTGKFFNSISTACGPKRIRYEDLGDRIMSARNPHYKKKN